MMIFWFSESSVITIQVITTAIVFSSDYHYDNDIAHNGNDILNSLSNYWARNNRHYYCTHNYNYNHFFCLLRLIITIDRCSFYN